MYKRQAIDREQHNRELVEQSRPLMTEKFFSDLLHYSGKDAAGHLGRYPGYLNLNLDFSCFNVLKLEVENASQAEDELGITQYQIELLNVCDLLGEPVSYTHLIFSPSTPYLGQRSSFFIRAGKGL